MKLQDAIGFKVSLLASSISKYASQTLEDNHSIGITEYRIIMVIAQLNGASIKEITDLIKTDKGWISRSVTSLLERDLITKEADKRDARKVTLKLTNTGKDLHKQLAELAESRHNKILSCLTDGERLMLIELIEKVQRNAEVLTEESGQESAK